MLMPVLKQLLQGIGLSSRGDGMQISGCALLTV